LILEVDMIFDKLKERKINDYVDSLINEYKELKKLPVSSKNTRRMLEIRHLVALEGYWYEWV